jgi:hypothetical protein
MKRRVRVFTGLSLAQTLVASLFAFALALALAAPVSSADRATTDKAVNDAAAYILRTVRNPQVDSVGGEWAVLGLARSGYDVSNSWYEGYYKTVEQYVKDLDGVLHEKKYTEYSRVILGLTAAGYDPRNVAGYDLTAALGDFERTVWQGINGPIWALIALDSADYVIPYNSDAKTQATRELYVSEILRRQIPDGGWNLTVGADGEIGSSEKGDPDMTGAALQALAKYQHIPEVKAATDKALVFLSELQDEKGGFYGWGNANSESVVQVLVALCELGIADDDPRFVKNGHTLTDNILSFGNADGSFRHTSEGSGDSLMSAEQAFYGIVAAQRARDGKNSLYRMNDAVKRNAPTTETHDSAAKTGLPEKHADVRVLSVINADKTFDDVQNHADRIVIEALASRGVLSGKDNANFDPDAGVTRAEFAAIVTRALGLPETEDSVFTDVPDSAWYAKPVGTAYHYGIVSGVTPANFNPNGAITRQETAVMVARAAKLCGMNTDTDALTIRDTLAQFDDYRTAADWAQGALAFCYGADIMDDAALDIKPEEPVRRAEIARMLHGMLSAANLL